MVDEQSRQKAITVFGPTVISRPHFAQRITFVLCGIAMTLGAELT